MCQALLADLRNKVKVSALVEGDRQTIDEYILACIRGEGQERGQ